MTKSIVLFLLLAGTLAPNASAGPKDFLKRHWKPALSVFALSGAATGDAITTCQHPGYPERVFGRGCDTAIGIDLGIAIGGSAAFLLSRKLDRNDHSKFALYRDLWPLIPATYMAVHDYHNATLPAIK